MSTVKMKFHEDKYVDGKIFARKDKEVDVELQSVDRWIKRGGTIVDSDPVEVEKMIDEEAADKAKKKYQPRK